MFHGLDHLYITNPMIKISLMMLHSYICIYIMRHAAIPCIATPLQRTATHYTTMQHAAARHPRFFVLEVVIQSSCDCTYVGLLSAKRCNKLQRFAVPCNTLLHTGYCSL